MSDEMQNDVTDSGRMLSAKVEAMAAQVVEAAEALAAARAESERVLAERFAAESVVAERRTAARAMSGNVRFCPVSERNRLPKPPRLPADPTEDELIVAAGNDAKLSPAQRIAVASLVCGQTAVVAARRAGVTPRTIHRWQQEPVFIETLARLTDDTIEAAARRVRTLLLRGTHVLADALQGDDQYRWAMRVVASPQVWKIGRREADAEAK